MILNDALLTETTRQDRAIWCKVMDAALLFDKYHGSKQGRGISKWKFECHSICRALAKVIPRVVVGTGYYVGVRLRKGKKGTRATPIFAEHSWLITPSGAIIDPYPVGFLAATAALVVGKGPYKRWGSNLYLPSKRVAARVPKMRGMAQKIKELAAFTRRAIRSRKVK